MSSEELLLVFVKNPQKGKVKTRLAESVGEQKALQIYRQLLRYTRDVIAPLNADLQVWYSSFIPMQDLWDDLNPQKRTQRGEGLGSRMKNAFKQAFAEEYSRLVIIGSDCGQLTTSILEEAFEQLKSHDAVIGPSQDGGYYLLGMNTLHEELFDQKEWSTPSVFEDTLSDIRRLGLSCHQLQELNDVDNLEDWQEVASKFSKA